MDSTERTFRVQGTEHTNPTAGTHLGVCRSRKEAVGWSAVTRGEIIGGREDQRAPTGRIEFTFTEKGRTLGAKGLLILTFDI